MTRKVLISLAHPDDETFGAGGLIAKYVSAGAEVSYICATDGARGTIADEILAQHGGSAEAVRYAELDCAAGVLGLKNVYKLGYCDSGMMGSETNSDPTCLWQADEEQVAARIAEIMRELQPQVVITFDPFGGYGHPDHIFMHRATVRAFHSMVDAGESGHPQKLYYLAIDKRLMRVRIWQARLNRQNPRKLGKNHDIDLIEIFEKAPPITTRINVRQWMDTWEAAALCHRSQANPRQGINRRLLRLVEGRQGLQRVVPGVSPGEGIERDIFAGVVD
jgi:LmbE family N-acetylglucosaminyl deacetylase